MSTHQIYIYRPGILQVTASMEKIDILAALLWEHQNSHTPLTKQELSLTTKMIEYSDNTAAESLWVTIGQLPSVTAFNKDLHYTQSITDWDWASSTPTRATRSNSSRRLSYPTTFSIRSPRSTNKT